MNTKATADGVQQAMSFWLNDHPVSMMDMLEIAIGKAIKDWLEAHEDEIIAQIAKAAKKP